MWFLKLFWFKKKYFWICLGIFFGLFLKLLRLLLKIMEVATDHHKWPKIAQTAWKALFLPKGQKSLGQSLLQELEVNPHSGLDLLVLSKCKLPSSYGFGVTGGMWHVTHNMWQVTGDMWHVSHETRGGEHCVKISSPKLKMCGSINVLKIGQKKDQSINESVAELLVEQPRVHRVC